MTTYHKYITTVAVIGLLAAGCSSGEQPKDLRDHKKETTIAEDLLAKVLKKGLISDIVLSGSLKPYNEVNIFPRVNAFVKTIAVDRGSLVSKGQLLATLEAPEMESQLQAANSRFTQATENARASKEKYGRLKEAAKEPGAVSPLDLDNAMARMKADEAIALSEKSNMGSVKTMQSYLQIYAPFDGMIIQRNVSPGALVSPGKSTDQPMFVLQDIKKLRLEVFIPENYVDKVDLKKPVSFIFNATPGLTRKAKISRSANTLGSTRSEAVEVDIANADQQLKPGMYAEVRIPLLSGARSLLVPNSAIVRSTERQYVIVVRAGRAVLVDVKEGLAAPDSTEVFGNLKAGELVLKQGNDEVKENDFIK
ncbi:efflux RND transporter periplasmic adaptor subunit [Pedobacter gandavensis]|uniref:Efflux RND transporter periplasmic adaptor subunit n=1 Tax=Pedobacter gandavensis TaxID=2679963 RepID=A0ABR6F1H9_9SPHI|nr:efflux RND transporter periplasmic adaptor subunit [Pedobacter gandavensis]MBB2151388.1 efflux RND transporter periplasmic adaptor subunit [Pedobacter gandavensis]